MKAYVLRGIADIGYEEVATPEITENTVLVKVEAAGICGSDIPRIYRTGAYHHPLIPGHEFSGRVVKTGEKVSPAWQDQRVGIFPLIPCRECPQCQKQRYEMCQNYSYLGSRTDGGFAEYVCVPEWNLLALPKEVSFEQAAMLEPASVAMHSVRGIGCTQQETAVICGLGTIGLLHAMVLKGMGCEKILLIGNKDLQKEAAERIGIPKEAFCDSRETDPGAFIAERTDGQGTDVFFECVGKNETVRFALDHTCAGGKVMLVGNPASDMMLEKDIYWKILRKQLTIKGTWNSSYMHREEDDWNQVIRMIREGRIHPERLITHRYALEDLVRGLEIMRDKSEEYIKIMTGFCSKA